MSTTEETVEWLKVDESGVLGVSGGMSADDLEKALGAALGKSGRRPRYATPKFDDMLLDLTGVLDDEGRLQHVLVEFSAYERNTPADAFNAVAAAIERSRGEEPDAPGKWEGSAFSPRRREWPADPERSWPKIRLAMGHDDLEEGMPILVELTVSYD